MAKKHERRQTPKRSKGRPARRPMAALAEALELYEDGEVGEAYLRLVQLARRYPRNKLVLNTLLEVCGELQEWSTFARYAEQLLPLEQGQDRAMILNNLVVAYTQLDYPALAWQAAQELAGRHPDFPDAGKIRTFAELTGEYLHQAGNAAEAIAAAERALARAPENFHALSNVARFSFLMANFDAARHYAARLEQLRGDNPDLPVKRAEALAFLGDDEGVREAYQRAKEQHGELPPLLLHLAAAILVLR